jgi:DNA-binding ferritin-like protein
MDKCVKTAALYIAALKAIALISRHNHWSTKGDNFYGSHLLFERLYNSALENLDLAAEKLIGLFGDQVLDYDTQTDLLNRTLSKYKNLEGSPARMCLAIEKDFLKLNQEAYKVFEDEGKLTLGLDDALCLISNKREESVYLLQQTLDQD